MDDLRRSVGLRGYGQRDPLVEYKREAFEMFTDLMGTIKMGIVRAAFTTTTNVEAYIAMRERMARRAQTQHQDLGDLTVAAGRAVPPPPPAPAPAPAATNFSGSFTVTVPGLAAAEAAPEAGAPQGEGAFDSLQEAMNNARQQPMPVRSGEVKIGRNDPCTCGSGKKYKNCCGR
jgi:preprotein translocase subunit SecA